MESKIISNILLGWYYIQYFELLADGTLVKLQDDWKIFCPKDHKWFPFDFKSKNGFVDEVYDDGL